MLEPRVSGGPIPSLPDVAVRPRPMRLAGVERRDPVRRAAIVHRIAAEFREMPGLVLSVAQASRLLGLDRGAAERIRATLEGEGVLRRRPGGSYALA